VRLLYELVGVAVLILLNAFFVAAEYGLVTARRTRIIELHHQGNRRARDVLRITSDPPRFIAAMQLGVTLTSLGIGALGEAALAKAFDPYVASALAIALAYLLLTFVHVVLGELVPKGIALGHSEGTALALAAPVRAFFTTFAPFVWVLRRSTEFVLKTFGLEPPGAEIDAMSEAELRLLLTRSTEQGQIEQEERGMIEKVFDFADKDAADVMVPRPEVVAISISLPTTSSESCTFVTCSRLCTTRESTTCISRSCFVRRTSCRRRRTSPRSCRSSGVRTRTSRSSSMSTARWRASSRSRT
jgi:CBS domain containing-hemolysin-like protein